MRVNNVGRTRLWFVQVTRETNVSYVCMHFYSRFQKTRLGTAPAVLNLNRELLFVPHHFVGVPCHTGPNLRVLRDLSRRTRYLRRI